MAYVSFTLRTDIGTSRIIGHINGRVLTMDQLKTLKFYQTHAFSTFTVRCDDAMALLKQFTDEGFELEDDFETIVITREPA